MKTCTKCLQEKPMTEFYKRTEHPGKSQSACKTCLLQARRSRYHTDPVYKAKKQGWTRDSQLKLRYGISADDYARLSAKQGGVCAICKQGDSAKRRLAVDHCHSTKRVRGLLCSCCNTAIGKLRDDPALIKAAADYVIQSQDKACASSGTPNLMAL